MHSNLVFLPTRVQSRKGETIYGLMPEEFIVEDNGVRQSVQVDEDADSAGVSLVVVVQCGRSAPSEFTKLKGLNTMIGGIVGDAPHEVAIVAYGEKPYVLDDFSSRPEAIPLALSRLKPCGDYHAVTIDAVSSAINMLNRRQNDYRHAILLISEMRDYGSRSRLPDIVAELGVNDIVIYSVAFSPPKASSCATSTMMRSAARPHLRSATCGRQPTIRSGGQIIAAARPRASLHGNSSASVAAAGNSIHHQCSQGKHSLRTRLTFRRRVHQFHHPKRL